MVHVGFVTHELKPVSLMQAYYTQHATHASASMCLCVVRESEI